MQQRIVNVHSLPRLVAREELAGSAVIVIDLLRATTTITQALASGASEVVPFLEVSEAIAAAERVGRTNVVLGGERNGGRIPDFDLGNSPAEYTPEAVENRRVFMTTTNGTRALDHARLARRVVAGAIVNLSSVVASVVHEPRVDILCAGTGGNVTQEDALAAGAMVHLLNQGSGAPAAHRSWTLNESAVLAQHDWEQLLVAARESGRALPDQLATELRSTPGGRNLLEIGLGQDLIDCAQVDRLVVVPELDVREWRIRLP